MTIRSRTQAARPQSLFATQRRCRLPALAPIAAALLLAACGGGGGGGDGVSGADATGGDTGVPLLVLTEANAKASAYNAVLNLSNPGPAGAASAAGDFTKASASAGGSLPERAQGIALSMARVARPGVRDAGDIAKAAVKDTVPCDGGGTLSAEGDLAAAPDLSTGDRLAIVATDCKLDASATSVLNGKVTLAVNKVVDGASPQVDIAFTFENFRIAEGDTVISMGGDMRYVTLPDGSGVEFTGRRLTTTAKVSGELADNTWQDYRQTFKLSGGTSRRSLEARIETLDSRLGKDRVAYQFTTPTPTLAREASDGTIRLQGQNSALAVTFSAQTQNSSVTLQLDSDGNGTYDKTMTYTVGEILAR